MAEKSTQNQLLDLIMTLRDLGSDYQLAAHLDVPLQTIRNYRKNRSNMDATMCVLIADELKMDPLQVIARIKCEASNDSRITRAWEKHLGRLLLVAAVALAPVDKPFAQNEGISPVSNIHYAHKFLLVLRNLTAAAVRRFASHLRPLIKSPYDGIVFALL